ncbi:glycosyltransferase family 2 protein [Croceicoccus sp. F390]|uniref:Glycosyltransferase family 2 protein n=1 Tax=Croceicoccus esteveae TaxID=3075597 RepID=A0ABU2ZI84_9SPHN|nr:glycosyltransferase family 2 protein [Croceicoccus sp. F390]MDT0575916.1 glycosyltransferase family 2 protein [Croceicoccus sp. F390]
MTVRDLVERQIDGILRSAPFDNRVDVLELTTQITGNAEWCVCMPVRNEQAALPATLAALRTASGQCPGGVVVMVVNDSSDGSARIVTDWAMQNGIDHVVIEITCDAAIRRAPFVRRLALDIGALLTPAGALLTTDADTVVNEDWIAGNLAHLANGAQLVCGTVDVDEKAIDALPGNVRRCGDVEGRYRNDMIALWQRWAGRDAPPLFIGAMGASLAMRAEAYAAIGGLPTPAVAEDKALALLARMHGLRIVEAADVRVLTSCRTDARAKGGMGDALLERATSDDPACDEALVPLSVLQRRADAWLALAGCANAELTFLELCTNTPQLQARRMHMQQVEREQILSQALLNTRLSGNPAPGALDERAGSMLSGPADATTCGAVA